MRVFFYITIGILLFILFIYINFNIKVKINLTFKGIVFNIYIKSIIFSKTYYRTIKYSYIIDKYKNRSTKTNNLVKKLKKTVLKILKIFYIKDIKVFVENYNDKLSLALEFSIVNIILKRGVLNG